MMQKRAACVRGEKCLPLTFKARLNCRVHHNPVLTSTEIADRAQIQHARLIAYASESHPGDNIPFKALLRLCSVIDAWDLIDAELNAYRRGVVEFDAPATSGALDESIDVNSAAAATLEEVRQALKDGSMDAFERVRCRERLRAVRAELEQLDSAIDEPKPRLAASR